MKQAEIHPVQQGAIRLDLPQTLRTQGFLSKIKASAPSTADIF